MVLKPESVASELAGCEMVADDRQEAALLVFVANRATLEAHSAQIRAAVIAERLTWAAYPKSGKLGTDLNRDSLAALLAEVAIRPVRQIAVDDTWSALRFRAGQSGNRGPRRRSGDLCMAGDRQLSADHRRLYRAAVNEAASLSSELMEWTPGQADWPATPSAKRVPTG